MKKILATILALVLALGLCSVSWAETTANCTDEGCAHKAAIGTTHYDTLTAAVGAATAGQTIVLVADTAEDITVASGKDITIDLNGKTVKNVTSDTITVALGAKLTIIGTGTVDNVTHGKAALINNGTATLDGGTYMRSQEDDGNSKDSPGKNSYYTIVNASGAAMTINAGVSVTNKGNFSSMIRNGGEGPDASTLTINGGMFSGGVNTVKNDEGGVLVVNGGNFSNTAQYVIMNWHKTTINNGTFKTLNTAKAVLFTSNYGGEANAAASAGELTITGGTFKRATDTQKMIVDAYDANNTGTASISGGTFDADVSQYLESGKQQNADGSVGNIPRYYYNSTTTTDTKKDDNKGTSPKTFDAGVGIYAVTAVLSVTGMAWTAKKRH